MLQYPAPLEEFNFSAHKVQSYQLCCQSPPHSDADLFWAALKVGAELTHPQLPA